MDSRQVVTVRYTDVDYDVFTDAAVCMWAGGSPYERATYRYTPLLAAALAPGVALPWTWARMLFGKVLFAALDLAVGALLARMLRARGAAPEYAALWLLNPIVVNVSTRGNAESFVVLWVAASIALLYAGRAKLAGVAFGLAVHVKIYPAVYALALFLSPHLDAAASKGAVGARAAVDGVGLRRMLLEPRRWVFAAAAIASFAAAGAACYAAYGYAFVHEAYLYHLTRADHRHNFSVYFYSMYLASGGAGGASLAMRLATFVPQAVLVVVISLRYARRHLPFALFALTVVFVALNKVFTVQYFVWYLLFLPEVVATLPTRWWTWVVLFALWLAAQAHWLAWAYRLEFLGEPVFMQLWIASLLFLACHLALVAVPAPRSVVAACR